MTETTEILERLRAIQSRLDALTAPWPEWMDLDTLFRYSGIPAETLWRFIRREGNPLPCSQPGGAKGLVRIHRVTFDRWMADQPRNGALSLDTVNDMVDAALADLPRGLQ